MEPQERALKSGVDIVVATPGRLMDHMRNGAVDFSRVDTFVLDEADRMMDMGFWPDVRRIAQTLPPPDKRQTLLFSATMPDEVMQLLDEVVREPKYVQIGSAGGPARSITHEIENVPAAEKTDWLAKFLRRTQGPILVFMRTKSGAERLARRLQSLGIRAAALHADRTQQQRTAAVEGFRGGRFTCWSPPTSRPAASTSTASRTSSITKCPRLARRTSTGSAGQAARRRQARP